MTTHVKVQVPVEAKLALTIDEAAAMIGLSRESLRKLLLAGANGEPPKLRRVPHTHRILIARVELERFVTENLHPSMPALSVVA